MPGRGRHFQPRSATVQRTTVVARCIRTKNTDKLLTRVGTTLTAAITQADLDRRIAGGTTTALHVGATCRVTDAEGVRFTDCVFERTSFKHANLAGARFSNCTFKDVSLRSADLTDSVFDHCEFYEVDSDTGCDFSYADLRRARFDRCDVTTAKFERIRAWSIELIACQASGADFSAADFTLDRGNLPSATFEQCNLAYADLSATNLAGAKLTGSRLVHAVLVGTRLDGADLSGCALDNIEAKGATFTATDLRGASFNNLDPRVTDLSDARMDPEQGLLILAALGIRID